MRIDANSTVTGHEFLENLTLMTNTNLKSYVLEIKTVIIVTEFYDLCSALNDIMVTLYNDTVRGLLYLT